MQLNKEQYEKTLKLHQEQQQKIRVQMEAQSALISDSKDFSNMLDEFVNNEGFYIKVQHLNQTYTKYRKTRRDGSCFYRALTFSIFENIYVNKDVALKEKMLKKIKDSKEFLLKAKFQGMIFQDIMELYLEKLDDSKITTIEDVVGIFCDPDISNYLILMMRFLTSGELKNNSSIYEIFLDTQAPIEFFCQTEVEPIDKEADQIQIMALLNYLQVGLKIIYLDGNTKNKEASNVVMPENTKDEEIKAILLYRPGHYDILYK